MHDSLLLPTLLIDQFGLFAINKADAVIFLLSLAGNDKLLSAFGILGFLLLKNFLHPDLKIFELVAANGFVVFEAQGIKFQQFA